MQASEIKLEIERLVPHDKLCKSKRKAEPGDCDCGHRTAVHKIDEFVYQLLRKIR